MGNNRPWLRYIEGTEGSQAGGSGEPEKKANDTGEPDWKAEAEKWKSFSRTWEERAKSNEEAKKRLDEIEEQGKSEAEKVAERLKAAEARDTELTEREKNLVARELIADLAIEFSISKEDRELFLTATDEETLRRQAEALSKRTGGGAENPNQGSGKSGSSKASATSWANSLLGKSE